MEAIYSSETSAVLKATYSIIPYKIETFPLILLEWKDFTTFPINLAAP
jgi:hypothetical protein